MVGWLKGMQRFKNCQSSKAKATEQGLGREGKSIKNTPETKDDNVQRFDFFSVKQFQLVVGCLTEALPEATLVVSWRLKKQQQLEKMETLGG